MTTSHSCSDCLLCENPDLEGITCEVDIDDTDITEAINILLEMYC